MPTLTTDRPLKDAVDVLSRKVPVGSAMSSREWEALRAEIKLRAMFSARVENERLLAEMQSRLQVRIALAKKDGRTMERGVFIEEMREELRQAGYKRGDAPRGSLRDLKSTRRLGLIWDMNIAQAQGFARWKADMTPEGLENEPCYEFIRVMDRLEVRNWPVIWGQHGGEFFDGPGSNDDYPNAPGRMIAAKNDPIWKQISRFGTPWPPFDWGSGMGLRGVDGEEAELLGVIGADDVVTPLDTPFNAETKASLKGISPEGRQRILDALAGDVEIVGDEIRIIPPDRLDAMAGESSHPQRYRFDGVDQPAPAISPRPLSEVLTVQGNKPTAVAIRSAISKADAVHGDGVLPQVQVVIQTPIFRPEIAGDYRPVASPGEIPFFRINPQALDVEFATLHETGHLLDNLGLHSPSQARLYASEGQPELQGLMRAIRQSVAAGRLAGRFGQEHYLLSSRELFARAYAQFIAERVADARMFETIRSIRRGEFEKERLYKNSQWNGDDFGPIRRAMRDLFNQAGWRLDQ